MAEVVSRCRQDVALMEGALSRPHGDLVGGVQAVAAEMRARGLTVHVEFAGDGALAVPGPVATAISNAAREALSNVAAHAGTGEAWVEVSVTAPEGPAPGRLQVTVRDRGTGFDPARVDQARLGLRRSIAERTAECGGRASIWSAPGEGTVVRISWPASARTGQATLAGRTIAQESLPW